MPPQVRSPTLSQQWRELHRGRHIWLWMTPVSFLPFGCRRHQHRGRKEVVYSGGYRWSARRAHDTDTAGPERLCTAGTPVVLMFPRWCYQHHHLKREMRGGTREREPIGWSPHLRSLLARASASQRFYWPTKYCSVVLTIETPFSLRYPRDGFTAEVTAGRAARASTSVAFVSTAARPTPG